MTSKNTSARARGVKFKDLKAKKNPKGGGILTPALNPQPVVSPRDAASGLATGKRG